MQIYLLKDLPPKGKAGDIINVNDGYGRNYVIKNGFGRAVDNAVLSQVRAKQESCRFHKAEEIAEIKVVCERLKDTVVKLVGKVGANGKLFGAITSTDVVSNLSAQGFSIDKKSIVMDTIKELGTYKIKVKFDHSLSAEFTLEVCGEN